MPRTIRDSISGVRARLRAADQPSRAGLVLRYWKMSVYGIYTPQLTTENPTTHTTDQHHVPMDPRAAELMPIHAARLALTRSVTQKAVDPPYPPPGQTDISRLLLVREDAQRVIDCVTVCCILAPVQDCSFHFTLRIQ